MKYLPVFLKLRQQPCLVVGGGPVAARKTELLLKAGAQVLCHSLSFCDRIQLLQQQHPAQLTLKTSGATAEAQELATDHFQIVIAATDNPELNHQIAEQCLANGQLCNTVNDGDKGNFIFPAIIDRNPVIAAVSSSGRAPVLTRLLRGKIESAVPAAFGHLADLADQKRELVKQQLPDIQQRREFWELVFSGTVAELVFSGQQQSAAELFDQQLKDAQSNLNSGEVYLVGTGPGDPDLLTFKALRLMQQADIVLYDALVSQPILDLVKRDAELIYVGKRKADHAVPQQGINQLLIDLAKQGRRVLRLKGGDPFVFGRGGEEIAGLMEQGIPFQVVPGITAANGCAAYAGIPLTHRDYSQSVRFVTGHLKDGTIDLPWQEFAYPQQTLVFYMGLTGLSVICQQLIKFGRDQNTPIALIERGTTPNQEVHTGTLSTMPSIASEKTIHAPTLIIVGDVVKLHSQLSWN
jgi:uroporphyrin-III C-methyltransferase/precorrin-2 dehydrogenase/sirohydrochlorin ferrochelatase